MRRTRKCAKMLVTRHLHCPSTLRYLGSDSKVILEKKLVNNTLDQNTGLPQSHSIKHNCSSKPKPEFP